MVPPDFVGRDDPGAPNHPSISTRPGGGEVGPLPLPVPPTKAMASAGPQRGRKDGSRRLLWQRLRTPPKAPFSLDSKNRSFSSREKETGFEPYPPSFYVAERQWTEMWFGAPGRRAPHQSDAAIYLSIFSLTPAFPLGGLLPCWNCSPPPGRRRPSPPTGADRSRGDPFSLHILGASELPLRQGFGPGPKPLCGAARRAGLRRPRR